MDTDTTSLDMLKSEFHEMSKIDLYYRSVALLCNIHCHFSDGCSVSCDDVTGTVAKEVTFTCSVPQHCAECSIKTYKLQNPESYKDSITCNQELPNFTCRFTPTTEIKEKFKFFVQTQCGIYNPEFSVNIAGTVYNTIAYNSINVCNLLSCLRTNCCMIMIFK